MYIFSSMSEEVPSSKHFNIWRMYFSVFFYNLDQTLPSPCEKKELVSKKLEMVEKAGSSSNRGNFSIILGKTNSIAF